MQNFMKTIFSAEKEWIKRKIKNSTADWNQNDPNTDNYVKNRTHWEEKPATILVENLTSEEYADGKRPECNFTPGEKYTVIWNGITYRDLLCYYDGEFNIVASEDNGTPFYIDDDGGNNLYIESDDTLWNVTILIPGIIHKLDVKFLDLPTNLATTDDIENAKQAAIGVANVAQEAAETAQSTAQTAQSTAETKMNKVDPSGSGTFSIGRVDGSIVGFNSTAIGLDVVAEYNCSFVEGKYNEYSDEKYVEVQIDNTETSSIGITGNAVYAYGSSYTFDKSTGKFTINAAKYKAWRSIPKGSYFCETTISSDLSRIYYYGENGKCVMATSNGLFYKYQDVTKISSMHISGADKYAHIVGNGTSDAERSNAYTLDWNGVGWYQGGLQVGGNAQDDGAKNVLLEGDAVPVPLTAQVGQTIVVKSIDEDGRPIEWETVDMVRGIPDYTSADEGKFLRIVNGVPAWVSIPNAEEASF